VIRSNNKTGFSNEGIKTLNDSKFTNFTILFEKLHELIDGV